MDHCSSEKWLLDWSCSNDRSHRWKFCSSKSEIIRLNKQVSAGAGTCCVEDSAMIIQNEGWRSSSGLIKSPWLEAIWSSCGSLSSQRGGRAVVVHFESAFFTENKLRGSRSSCVHCSGGPTNCSVFSRRSTRWRRFTYIWVDTCLLVVLHPFDFTPPTFENRGSSSCSP
jgi:hypothetical protein